MIQNELWTWVWDDPTLAPTVGKIYCLLEQLSEENEQRLGRNEYRIEYNRQQTSIESSENTTYYARNFSLKAFDD